MPKMIFWDKKNIFTNSYMNSDLKILLSCYIHFCDHTQKLLNLAKVDAKSDFLRQEKHFYKQLHMNSDLKLLLSCYIHFCDIRKNCWILAKVDAKSDFLRQRKTFLQTELYEFWFEIIIILLYPFLRYTQKLLNVS